MKKIIILQIIVALGLLAACAVSPNKKAKSSSLSAKDGKTAETLRAKQESLQDRKDRNRILQKKNELNLAMRAVPQRKKIEFSPQVFTEANKLGERDLYAELLNSYNRNDVIRFQSYYRSFKSRFSKGALADDAIYLNGMFALSDKQYGDALLAFNEIINKYSFSNKATAATYAKGVVLKRMNLTDASEQVFKKVIKKYPGSPEALRARVELGQVK